MKADALLVDLDGTLADTHGILFDTYSAFLRRHGAQPSEAEFRQLDATPIDRAIEALCRVHSIDGAINALVREYQADVQQAHQSAPPVHGAEELVQWARQTLTPLALVTSASRAIALRWLEAKGMASSFNAVVAAEDVSRHKPSPDPYLEAAMRTNADPRLCVAIDDSASGVRSACAAGCWTFALSRTPSTDDAYHSAAHIVRDLGAVLRILQGGTP